jgi:hypothetical protein
MFPVAPMTTFFSAVADVAVSVTAAAIVRAAAAVLKLSNLRIFISLSSVKVRSLKSY